MKMTVDELQAILEEHKKWLDDPKAGKRAILVGASLVGADLARASLARANLAEANLAEANLAGADLAEANLAGADLAEADLAGADLAEANLARAYLARANLAGAYLAEANLAGASLGKNRILQIGPTGSRRDQLVVKWGPHLDEVQAGCWRGTLVEFEARNEAEHGDDEYGKEYRAVIAMLKALRA